MRAAKVRAAQRGESLKHLFTRAIAHEVSNPGRGRPAGRLTFPLIGRDDGPRVEVTQMSMLRLVSSLGGSSVWALDQLHDRFAALCASGRS
jgi:hypothetical protein